jgi:hypothetical protein
MLDRSIAPAHPARKFSLVRVYLVDPTLYARHRLSHLTGLTRASDMSHCYPYPLPTTSPLVAEDRENLVFGFLHLESLEAGDMTRPDRTKGYEFTTPF